MKDLAVGGATLIKEGYEPGKKLGAILDYLFNQVLDNPSLNEAETLLALAKEFNNSLN